MLYEKIDPARLNYGLLMLNHYWFMRHYWKDDLTITPSIKQRQVFSDTSKKMLLCTARKTFKTGMLEATVIRAALAKTTSRLEEYMFHTPAQAHMNPVRDRIISKLQSVATFNALITSMNPTDGVIEFATNCKWWFRIEGLSNTGKNMIGIRAEIIVGDEGAYSNEAAHRERQLTKTPTCREVWCGVPNGVRGTPFFRADQDHRRKAAGMEHSPPYHLRQPALPNGTGAAATDRGPRRRAHAGLHRTGSGAVGRRGLLVLPADTHVPGDQEALSQPRSGR